jgi:hypothetical protein
MTTFAYQQGFQDGVGMALVAFAGTIIGAGLITALVAVSWWIHERNR